MAKHSLKSVSFTDLSDVYVLRTYRNLASEKRLTELTQFNVNIAAGTITYGKHYSVKYCC